MTTCEHLMLSVTFGCTLGWLISGVLITIRCIVRDIKDRRDNSGDKH